MKTSTGHILASDFLCGSAWAQDFIGLTEDNIREIMSD